MPCCYICYRIIHHTCTCFQILLSSGFTENEKSNFSNQNQAVWTILLRVGPVTCIDLGTPPTPAHSTQTPEHSQLQVHCDFQRHRAVRLEIHKDSKLHPQKHLVTGSTGSSVWYQLRCIFEPLQYYFFLPMHFLASFRQDQVLMMCADSESNVAMVWSKILLASI